MASCHFAYAHQGGAAEFTAWCHALFATGHLPRKALLILFTELTWILCSAKWKRSFSAPVSGSRRPPPA